MNIESVRFAEAVHLIGLGSQTLVHARDVDAVSFDRELRAIHITKNERTSVVPFERVSYLLVANEASPLLAKVVPDIAADVAAVVDGAIERAFTVVPPANGEDVAVPRARRVHAVRRAPPPPPASLSAINDTDEDDGVAE